MAVQRLFPEIAPEERTRFRLTAAGFVCVAASALIARVAGDALFLSRYGSEFLPYMYIGSALVLVLASLAYGVGARYFPPTTLAIASASLLAGGTALLRLLLASPDDGWRLLSYFLADLVVNLPMMLFWGLAALVFNPREGKRLFGVVGAAGTATCIAVGAVVRPAATRFGTENLLLAVVVLLLAFVAVVFALARLEAQRFQQAVRSPSAQASANPSAARVGYWAALLKQPQIRNLALLTVLASLATVLIDYQFKTAARARYTGPDLAGFIGSFYSGANVVTLLVQLLLVHRILKVGGVLVGLSVLPAGVLAASLGTVASAAAFPWVVASRLMDPVFNFTINSASLQILYLGIKKQTRSQARAFVDGTCKPIAIAFGGTALVAMAGTIDLVRIATAVCILAALWLLLAWRNHVSYVVGLIDSVGARRFELSAEDMAVRDRDLEAHIKQSLLTASNEDLPYLIGVLPQLGRIDASAELEQLLDRDSPSVKVSALEYLRHRRVETSLPTILRHCEHPDAVVRAAAVHAAGAFSDKSVVETLERRLSDEATVVRAAAAAELINSGDLDALLAAGVALKGMLTSPDPQARIAATGSLASIRHGELTRLLAVLLRDPESEVLRVALEAAASHPTAELLPAVVSLLDEPRVGATAAETLVAYGAEALQALAALLDARRPLGVHPGLLRVPAIIARIGDARGFPLLERTLEDPDAPLREEAIGAWCRLIGQQASVKPHLEAIDRAVARELESAAGKRASLARIAGAAGVEVLSLALEDEYASHLKNVFTLLDARTPDVDMNSLYFGLTRGTPEARAEALELLDNVLAADSKRKLLDLLESGAAAAGRTPGEGPGAAAAHEIVELLAPSLPEWVRVGALHAAGANRVAPAGAGVRAALADPSPVVRETALQALFALLAPADAVACARRMGDDPDARVRRLATALLAGGA